MYWLRSKNNIMPAPSNATSATNNEQPEEIVNPAPLTLPTATAGTSSNTVNTVPHIIPPPPGFASHHGHRYHVNFESFSGRGNATEFWAMFMAFVTLQGMPEVSAILILPFHLTGIAREWFNVLDNKYKVSLTSIKEAFLKRFKPLIKRGVKLTDLKQGDTESVDDYIHRAMSFNSENSVSEDFLVSITEKGFRKNLAHIIMPHRSQTMEQLREIAAVAEVTVSVTAQPQSPTDLTATINHAVQSAVQSCEANQANLLTALLSRMETTLSAVNRPEQHRVRFNDRHQPNSQHGQSSKECKFCGGRSCTIRSNCPASNKICHFCKKLGHFKKACLKLKRAQGSQSD